MNDINLGYTKTYSNAYQDFLNYKAEVAIPAWEMLIVINGVIPS